MIKSINFENFKCLDKQRFSLRKVNLFTGYNGRGKSSVLQSILLLSQSVNEVDTIQTLHMRGSKVDLGAFYELLTDDKQEEITFDIELDALNCESVHLKYQFTTADPFIGQLSSCRINNEDFFGSLGSIQETSSDTQKNHTLVKPIPVSLLEQLKNVHYISANRVGPVKYVENKELPKFLTVGADGLFAINAISLYKGPIPKEMNIPIDEELSSSLTEAVSKWVSYIMDGGSVSVGNSAEDKGKASSVLSLQFNMRGGKTEQPFYSYNVGFGYSYVLSVIVTSLIAQKDSIVIIENPEAHLHAQAQSRLTLLLSKLADRGVQVFIETHSEHIVNGFRLAALKEESAITNEDISIHFFDNDYSIKQLIVQKNGRIDHWPDGFFDQAQNDYAEIIRLGAKVQ